MASKYDSLHVVRDFVDANVKDRGQAFALGYVSSELVDCIELLSPAKREKFLEMLARRTESVKEHGLTF